MKNPLFLKGKNILITGGNGQIAEGLIRALIGNGAFVYITDKDFGIRDGLKNKLKKEKLAGYRYVTLDVTKESSILLAKEKIIKPIDILINNAGTGVYTPFEKRTEEELAKVISVNLVGTILCSKIFSSDMIKRKKGLIINFGSIYGVTTPDFRIYGKSGRNSSEIYGATKAGIIHFTKYLAAYLSKYGVRANAISPGGVFNNQDSFFVQNYEYKTPLGRMAKSADLEGAILFLCSDSSNYITGQNIIVDGGFTLW